MWIYCKDTTCINYDKYKCRGYNQYQQEQECKNYEKGEVTNADNKEGE